MKWPHKSNVYVNFEGNILIVVDGKFFLYKTKLTLKSYKGIDAFHSAIEISKLRVFITVFNNI